MTKIALQHTKSQYPKASKQKAYKLALSGERIITSSEAEDILNKILSDYVLNLNLN
jgi:hypothetical protein